VVIQQRQFLTGTECKGLMQAWDEGQKTNTANTYFTDMVVYWGQVREPEKRLMLERCWGVVERIKSLYKVAELYPSNLLLCTWPPGKGMPLHFDNQNLHTYSTPHWIYSCTVYLNDDFVGGEIHFPELGLKIRPEPGLLVTFPSTDGFKHEVLPASRPRYTMPMWFSGTADKQNFPHVASVYV
jgi:hypothetical protein